MTATNLDPLWDFVGVADDRSPEPPEPCCYASSAARGMPDHRCDWLGHSSDPGEFFTQEEQR